MMAAWLRNPGTERPWGTRSLPYAEFRCDYLRPDEGDRGRERVRDRKLTTWQS
jgi:hypothetical protein